MAEQSKISRIRELKKRQATLQPHQRLAEFNNDSEKLNEILMEMQEISREISRLRSSESSTVSVPTIPRIVKVRPKKIAQYAYESDSLRREIRFLEKERGKMESRGWSTTMGYKMLLRKIGEREAELREKRSLITEGLDSPTIMSSKFSVPIGLKSADLYLQRLSEFAGEASTEVLDEIDDVLETIIIAIKEVVFGKGEY